MSAQETARTTEEGGAVDLESPLWPDTGTAPTDVTNYAYAAYEEPGAGPDNAFNYKTSYDHGQLNYRLGTAIDRLDTLENELDQLRSDLNDLESSFGSHTHDSRYYTQSEADDRFVNVSGDTMTGTLTQDSAGAAMSAYEAVGETSTYSVAAQDGNGGVSQYWNVEAGSQNIIAENEGAAWWNMGGGSAHLDLYDGESDDGGTTPAWTRALTASTTGVTLDSGATMGDALDAGGNDINGVRHLKVVPKQNDVMRISDGSDGSVSKSYTFRYDTRALRFYAGDTGTDALRLEGDGEAVFGGDTLTIAGASTTVSVGASNTAGPHQLRFGNDGGGAGQGLQLSMRTGPNNLAVENPGGGTIWYTSQDDNAVNFGNANYVALPVRSGPPPNAPSGGTWIET